MTEHEIVDHIKSQIQGAAEVKAAQMLKGLVGCKIRFPEGNKVPLMMDMAFTHGVPHAIEFTIAAVMNDSLALEAPGFGDPKDYGSGRVFARVACLERRP